MIFKALISVTYSWELSKWKGTKCVCQSNSKSTVQKLLTLVKVYILSQTLCPWLYKAAKQKPASWNLHQLLFPRPPILSRLDWGRVASHVKKTSQVFVFSRHLPAFIHCSWMPGMYWLVSVAARQWPRPLPPQQIDPKKIHSAYWSIFFLKAARLWRQTEYRFIHGSISNLSTHICELDLLAYIMTVMSIF